MALVGLYLIVTTLTAYVGGQAVRTATSVVHTERYWQTAVWLTLLASAFFLPFFIIGTLELLVGGPRVALSALLVVSVMLLLIGAIARWRTGNALTFRPPLAEPIRWLSWNGLTGLATIVVFVIVAAMLTVGYPRGFEVSAYHLPISVHVFQTGSLRV